MGKYTTKTEYIMHLTKDKTRQFTLALNSGLVELFKEACNKNDIKPTRLIEAYMIDYIDKNDLLEK